MDQSPNSEPDSRSFEQAHSDTGSPKAPPPPPLRPRRAKRSGCIVAVVIAGMLVAGGLAALFVFGLFVSGMAALGLGGTGGMPQIHEEVVEPWPDVQDKIVIIDITGIIQSGIGFRGADPYILRQQFRKAIDDPHVRAVILNLNTPGGEVTASDEIHRAVKEMQRRGNKPVVGCMRSVCASGGYYIAAACDYLVANRVSLTGSIGVIFPHFAYHELFDKVGIRQSDYASGKMKDMFSGGIEHSEAEQLLIDSLMQDMVSQTFDRFLEVIAEGRDAYNSIEDLRSKKFTDGRVILGADAKDYGLVDELGYMDHAIRQARKLAKAPKTKVVRYRRPPSIADLLSAKSGEQRIKIEGLPQVAPDLKPYNMYYLMLPLGE